MFIRSLADFNGTPWAVQVTVGAITVTAQATSSPDRHDKQGSGDFYLARRVHNTLDLRGCGNRVGFGGLCSVWGRATGII